MKKLFLTLTMGSLLWASHLQGQIVLQALDAPEKEMPKDHIVTLPDGVRFINGGHWISSILDDRYLPFRESDLFFHKEAEWSTNDFDPDPNNNYRYDSRRQPLIDVKGKIPASGMTLYIPIVVNNIKKRVTIPAYKSYTKTVAEAWVDKRPRILELSWDEYEIVTDYEKNKRDDGFRGYIPAKLKVYEETEDSYITQLDLLKGLGDYYVGILLGTFKLPGKSNARYFVRVISGILDSKFGVSTNIEGKRDYYHRFIYKPVLYPFAGGKEIWLTNNLGAEYADMNSPHFDPNMVAGGDSADPKVIKSDSKAYGSLFQWGREADGHELMDWTPTKGTRRYQDILLHQENTHNYQTRWNTNICPLRFSVPSAEEFGQWESLHSSMTGSMGLGGRYSGSHSSTDRVWQDVFMRFTASGYTQLIHDNGKSTSNTSHVGLYWSSTKSAYGHSYADYFFFENKGSIVSGNTYYEFLSPITNGLSVRCVYSGWLYTKNRYDSLWDF